MKKLIVAAAVMMAGCSAGMKDTPTEATLPPGYVTLATFTGEVDPIQGTFTIKTDATSSGVAESRLARLVIPEGSSTVTIANTGTTPNVDVWNNHASPTGACGGALVTGARVNVTLGLPSPAFLGAVYARITDVSGTNIVACGTVATPSGLTGTTWGIWSYGTLTQAVKTQTAEWNFLTSTGARFDFRGEIIAVKVTTPIASPDDAAMGETVAYNGSNMAYVAANDLTHITFIDFDGTPAGKSPLLPGDVQIIAADNTNGRIWFATTNVAPNWTYVGYVTSDGVTARWVNRGYTAISSIAPNTTSGLKEAWCVGSQSPTFQQFTIDGSGDVAVGIGVIPVGLYPTAAAFGGDGNYWVSAPFNLSYGAKGMILVYSQAGALLHSYDGEASPAACVSPQFIIPRSNGTMAFLAAGKVCSVTQEGSFSVLGSVAYPRSIVEGTDGYVWAAHGTAGTYFPLQITRLVPGDSTLFTTGFGSVSLFGMTLSPGDTGRPAYIWSINSASPGLVRLEPW